MMRDPSLKYDPQRGRWFDDFNQEWRQGPGREMEKVMDTSGHIVKHSQTTAIEAEYLRARTKFPKFNSAHEGYAVMLEEVEEMWEAIKKNDIIHARAEAVQVAAMALAFLMEVYPATAVEPKEWR